MVSILACLQTIKRNPQEFLDPHRVQRMCEKAGYHPRGEGPLDPATTTALFMQQVLEGNVSCATVRHLGGQQFTPQAYCSARMRLPLSVVKGLACNAYQEFSATVDAEEEYRWLGHRVLLIDGSSFSMPDTPELQARFGQPGMQKAGCGFPVAHLLALFNARTGLAVDALTAPLRTHEASEVGDIQQQMQPGDLVLGDDSFGTFPHLALLQQKGLHGLFPTHHQRIVDFTPHRPCIDPGNAAEGKGLPRSRWIKWLGHTRPIGGVAQAAAATGLDDPTAVEEPAGFDPRAGSAPDDPSLPPASDHADDRHHAAGPQGVSGQGSV